MKYETPELMALKSAINAIQAPVTKAGQNSPDGIDKEPVAAYVDWEA